MKFINEDSKEKFVSDKYYHRFPRHVYLQELASSLGVSIDHLLNK